MRVCDESFEQQLSLLQVALLVSEPCDPERSVAFSSTARRGRPMIFLSLSYPPADWSSSSSLPCVTSYSSAARRILSPTRKERRFSMLNV